MGSPVQRLHDEVRDDAAIVRVHARSVGVEDSHDLDVEPVLAVIVEEQGLGAALALVVARRGPDRIDVAPVLFGLRMNRRDRRTPRWSRPAESCAFTRLAKPSMLMAPCTLVFVVWTGSCW